jgi:replicative DNA helicase
MDNTQPHNIESEEALLGALLIDPAAYITVAANLQADDFYRQKNRYIWEAIDVLKQRGDSVDHVTVSDELEKRGRLEEIGGAAYLTHLLGSVGSVMSAKTYAESIRSASVRRQLIRAASGIAKLAYDEEIEAEEAQAKAEGLLLGSRRDGSGTVELADLMPELYEDVTYWREHPGEPRGLLTGLNALDKMLGGLKSGLYLLAARPSLGKTSVALQVASNVARRGQKVIIFTLEMSEEQIRNRLTFSEARLTQQQVESGETTEEEHTRLIKAMGEVADWPIVIHEGTVTAGDIRAVTQRETMRGGDVGLVIVDYLGLMAASKQADTRNLELGAISRGLLLAAKDLDTPILAVHQLNRSVDNRADKRPMLSDLRESGRLEEDADVVLMLYRDGYYYPESERADIMEIWVRKNRLGGPAGERCEMYWRGRYMRCEPLIPISEPSPEQPLMLE